MSEQSEHLDKHHVLPGNILRILVNHLAFGQLYLEFRWKTVRLPHGEPRRFDGWVGGRAAGGGTSVVPLQTGRGTPDHRTGRLPQDTQQQHGVKALLQPDLEKLEAHMESTTTSVQVQAAALLQQGRLGSLTFDYDLERHIKVIQKV